MKSRRLTTYLVRKHQGIAACTRAHQPTENFFFISSYSHLKVQLIQRSKDGSACYLQKKDSMYVLKAFKLLKYHLRLSLEMFHSYTVKISLISAESMKFNESTDRKSNPINGTILQLNHNVTSPFIFIQYSTTFSFNVNSTSAPGLTGDNTTLKSTEY